MDALHVFVSHASANDAVVARLRNALEDIGVSVWTDSQHLSGGVPLEEEIFQAIETADHFLVLISLASLDSKWVEKEIRRAQDVQKKRGCAYKVIPIL
ncbi:MAG: toll/interleukin-1 receptor domain-containing protein, partial [Planctomycetes bacterium]|nr:toll/interleukin-1 receptor domain-containing protein [Planctomycetota bacterium]